MMGKAMLDGEAGAVRPRSVVRMLAFGTALLVLAGAGLGFVAAMRGDETLDAAHASVLGVFALLIGGCAWLLFREARRPTGADPLTPNERLNLNLVVGCAVAGFLMGLLLVASGGSGPPSMFSDAPIPPVTAAIMIAAIVLILPVSAYWHRIVDEQEADAYKAGALWGIYVYWIGAAVWWFAWRGGFVPEPDGVLIYLATIVTVGAIWLWKKYR